MPTKVAKKKSKKAPRKTALKTPRKTAKKSAPKPLPPSTGFWLLKSEPESYSIDAFANDGQTLWTGVRNYLARNYMMSSMKTGDRFLFYHSNAEPSAVVGIGEVLRPNQPDPTAQDKQSDYFDPKASKDHPIWFCAEVGFVSKFKKPLTLEDLKPQKELAKMSLLQKGQRLSVMPITKSEFEVVVKMAGAQG